MTRIFSRASLPRYALLGAALCVAACAGNGEGLDVNGQPIVPGEGNGSVPLSADFDSLQANIFTPICSVCHAGAGAPEGLRLDAQNSYNLLVGVPSTEVPTLMRVKPGDPANSYIIQKLEGLAAVGKQMPLGGPYLQPDVIAFVAQWITNGAPPAASAAAAAPLALTSTVPDSVDPVTESPPQVTVAFNHDIDVSQIDMNSARIEKLAPGATAAVMESISARLSVPDLNRKVLMIWPAQPLENGRYRALIRTASPGLLSDIAGRTVPIGTPNSLGESVVAVFEVEVSP